MLNRSVMRRASSVCLFVSLVTAAIFSIMSVPGAVHAGARNLPSRELKSNSKVPTTLNIELSDNARVSMVYTLRAVSGSVTSVSEFETDRLPSLTIRSSTAAFVTFAKLIFESPTIDDRRDNYSFMIIENGGPPSQEWNAQRIGSAVNASFGLALEPASTYHIILNTKSRLSTLPRNPPMIRPNI